MRQFPVSEEAKFCAQGFKIKIFLFFLQKYSQIVLPYNVASLPHMPLGSPAQGNPHIPVAEWKFCAASSLFFQAGERPVKPFVDTSTGMCSCPGERGWCGAGTQGEGAAAMQHELKPTLSTDATVLLPQCIQQPIIIFITDSASRLLSKEPPSTDPWQQGMLCAAPRCEDPQLVPSLLPCCSSCSAPCSGLLVGFQSH